MKQHLILAVAWIAFCFLHSLLADVGVKQNLAKSLGKSFRYFRLYYSLFAAITFFIVLIYQVGMNSFYLFQPNNISYTLGLVTAIVGLIIMAVCIRKYFAQLSGLKTLFIDEVKTGNVLIITGIHRFVRHPLYAGTFIFIWGLFIFVPYSSLLISNFIITVYTLIGIGFEEKKLIKEFGDQYQEYKRKVPMILPSRKPSPD